MSSLCRRLIPRIPVLRDERGQTAVEYAMVMSFVALLIAAALASGLTDVFSTVWSAVTNAL
jgi:Flp pilus assembly pilin Flp